MTNALAGKTRFLFDLDGTLVDSASLHARAYVGVLQRVAPALAATFDYEKLAGKTTRLAFAEMGFPEPQLPVLVAEKQRAYLDALDAGALAVLPFAHELLAWLAGEGHTMYLVTSASRRSTTRVLEATGIGRHFVDVVTGDDVAHGKPAPDGYRRIVTEHALDPKSALVIEDAVAGLMSAAAAGVDAVTVHATAPLAAPSLATFKTLAELRTALAAG